MIRAALLALFLVAACGKSSQKKSEPDVVGSAAQPRAGWLSTLHADGTFVVRPEVPDPPRAGERLAIAKAIVAEHADATGLAQVTLVAEPIRDPKVVVFAQTAHGHPVLGANVVVRFAEDGGIESLTGRRVADIAPPDDTQRDASAAIAAFEKHVGSDIDGFDASWLAAPAKAELVWWAPGIEAPKLVHAVSGTLASRGRTLAALVGDDGEVLAYTNGSDEVRGSGDGAWGKRTFEVEARGQSFAMRRALIGPWPASCGASPARQPIVEIWQGDAVVASTSYDGPWDGNKPITERVIVDAYIHAEQALRYFRDRFCRNSYDGVGSDVPIYIAKGGTWNGTYMNLGPGGFDNDTGFDWLSYSSTLEVVTHEITHGIINTTVGSSLPGSRDLAAIAEALGDVFGQFAEEHYGVTYGRARTMGQIGENWAVPAGKYLRRFDDTKAMFAERTGDKYVDSTQVSSAFYRMVTGAEKLTLNQAESVWYGALARLTSATTFASFAHDTLLVTMTMNRAQAQIPMKPIACAWVSVGVLLRADVASTWKIDCTSPSDDTLAGHWDWTLGDWGTMSFARAGDETKGGKKVAIVRGVYTYRSGSVLLRCDEALRACTGQWFEGSRACGVHGEHGDAAFAVASPGALDGKWLHLGESVWRQDWDLKRSKKPVPDEDKKRLADDALFRCK